MPARPSEKCPLCGARVRSDRLLTHRERAHPRDLSAAEREMLRARDEERDRRRALEEERVLQAARSSPPPAAPEGRDEGEVEASPLETLIENLLPPRDRVDPPPGVDPALWGRLRGTDHLLLRRCGERLYGEEEEDEQARWEAHVHERWLSQIGSDLPLAEAIARLVDADLPKYRRMGVAGYEQRRAALEGPLGILRGAGERAVPYLAGAMTTDSWASILAVELLFELPGAPRRDRALVEALFLPGDWAPETAERAALSLDPARRWPLFEEVARDAQGGGIELQSVYWTSLFEEGTDEDLPRRPLPDLERAAILLYDLGHHSALVAGLGFLLDPGVSGIERVEANLEEGRLERALAVIEERPPGRRPGRALEEE